MSLKKSRFIKGIILAPDNAALDGVEGEIKVDSSTGKIQVTLKDGVNPSASREIITSSQTQTLTNKTLTSPVLDTGVSGSAIDIDGTLAANSDTKLASQKAVKTYVDAQIGSKDEADEIIYDNTTSGLVATNVQTAIDEVDGNVDNLVTLSGVALDSTTLGTFTGTTIPDNSDIKEAIQSLETSHESHTGASSGVHGVAGSVVGTSDSQALTNKTIDADLNTISNIENADIKVGAAIARAKLASGTANRIVVNDATGVQVDAAAITASRALVSDANGIPTHSSTTSTEIGHLSGVTSAIQTQLDGKVDESGGTLTSGSVITPARLDVKQDTKANLTTYALTATNGQIVYATDTKEMFQVIDGLLEGIGGGEGVGGTDILFAQTFETAALTDFTQTGLSLSTSNPLHGEISALLTHDASVNQLFKQVIPVDNKFRNQTMVLRLDVKSNASAGNVVINIYDETNAANIVASEQLQLSNDVNGTKNSVGFTIPETCASISYTITALPEAGSPVTRIDDIICELAETALLETVVELTGNAQTLTIPLTQSGLITQPDENYQLNGFTYRTGSTNTNILFFNDGTIANNNLSTISINNDSVLGSTFTIQRDGFYSFNFQAELGGTAGDVYLVKNSTTAVSANILSGFYENGAQFINSFAWSGPLKQGDVIRIIRSGVVATFTADARNYLSISYVGNVKQVSVNPNSKITIPTSELRFEGASTRGSTATAIVRFDTIAKIRGDAFTVVSNSVDGTYVQMKKAGKLDISSNLFSSVDDRSVYISKNQVILTTIPSGSETMAFSAFNTATTGSPVIFVSYSGFVQIGDVFRIVMNGTPTAEVTNQLNLAFQEQEIQVSVSNTLPQFSESDSSVRVDGSNGYGTNANNKVQRFSNVRTNLGSDIIYLPSATEGDSFLVNSDGIYNISFSNNFVTASDLGIVLNATDLITGISTQPRSGVLNQTTTGASNWNATAQWSGFLNKGSVIRAFNDGAAIAVAADTFFTISKVGKPNVTGVNVTPFVNVPQPESQFLKLINGSAAVTTDITNFSVSENAGSSILSYTSNGRVTALKDTNVDVTFVAQQSGPASDMYVIIQKNGSTYIQNTASRPTATGGYSEFISSPIKLYAGEYLTFRTGAIGNTNSYVHLKAEALSDQILTAPETFSTDTAALTYAGSGTYNLTTLANAPVGTFITFTYAANTNTRTQTVNTAPNQSPADMNANGILLYTRAYNVLSSAAQPAAIAIQIGKGMKGKSLDLYKSAGKLISGEIDFTGLTSASQRGIGIKSYNELTGVLLVDAGINALTSYTSNDFQFSDATGQSSGYLVINASKNSSLTGMNIERVSARAVNSSGNTVSNGTTITYDPVKSFDTHGALNTTTGVFTSPETGYYQISGAMTLVVASHGGGSAVYINGVKNNIIYSSGVQWRAQTTTTQNVMCGYSDLVYLAKGDTFKLITQIDRGATNLFNDAGYNYFSITKTNIGGRS